MDFSCYSPFSPCVPYDIHNGPEIHTVVGTHKSRQSIMYLTSEGNVIKPCDPRFLEYDDDFGCWEISAYGQRCGERPDETVKITESYREKVDDDDVDLYHPSQFDNSAEVGPTGTPIIGLIYPYVMGTSLEKFWRSATKDDKMVIICKLRMLTSIMGTQWDWNSGNIIVTDAKKLVLIDHQIMRNNRTAIDILDTLDDVPEMV